MIRQKIIFFCAWSAGTAFVQAFFHGHLHSLHPLSLRDKVEWRQPLNIFRQLLAGEPTYSMFLHSARALDEDTAGTSRPQIYVEDQYVEENQNSDSTVISVIAEERKVGGRLCQGALRRVKIGDRKVYQACITRSSHSVSASIDLHAAVMHELLLRYLHIEMGDVPSLSASSSTTKFMVLSPNEYLNGIDAEELSSFLRNTGLLTQDEIETSVLVDDSLHMVDLHKFVPHLNEYSFQHRGTPQGRNTLMLLKELSQRRVPFDFENHHAKSENRSQTPTRRCIISNEVNIIPPSEVKEVMGIMQVMKERKWLSNNPDSVDGLPSLHLNLISGGSPMFDMDPSEEGSKEDNSEEVQLFQQNIAKMTSIVSPYLQKILLPRVQGLTNSPTVEISDVFIRNYGQVNLGSACDNEETTTRYSLSSHYDVTSFATCVIALDDTASSGKSGLYTIPLSSNDEVSNHSALKQFFRLNTGDGVIHTYDILHGVDVDPEIGSSRTSLIVWFVDRGDDQTGQEFEGPVEDSDLTHVSQPWLLNPREHDDVGQFILALASDSGYESDGSELKIKHKCNPFDLYVSSASRGNAFALTSLGQLCDDHGIGFSREHFIRIDDLLRDISPSNPFLPKSPTITNNRNKVDFTVSSDDFDLQRECNTLAMALWYKASMSGNRIAQVSLADELMLQYMRENRDCGHKDVSKWQQNQEDILLMASTLFTMALNQGYETAKDSLKRLMDIECSRLAQRGVSIPSEEFFEQPVVQTVLLSS